MNCNFHQGRYPTREGIAIPASELRLPLIEPINLVQEFEESNHHDCWERRKFGNHILYVTLRKLDICQSILPNSIHDYIHSTYSQPKLPRPNQAYAHIQKASEMGSLLRTGTACRPKYEPISEELIKSVYDNYKNLEGK